MQIAVEASAKEVADGGKSAPASVGEGLGGTHFPGTLKGVSRGISCLVVNNEEPDFRMVGGIDFLRGISHLADAHFHVGLAATEPDITDENLVQLDLLWAID